MMKKLICLIVVLAVAGAASAATSKWIGTTGNWEVASNWTGSGAPPSNSLSNPVYAFRDDGAASTINVTTFGVAGTAIAQDLYLNNTTAAISNLIIQNGAKLENGKNTYLNSTNANAIATVTIDAGGLWISGHTYAAGGSLNVASGVGALNSAVINVYGTLNVQSNGTGTATLYLANNGGSGYGNDGTVNVYGGGIVNVDNYIIGTKGTGRIYIENGGVMWIKGDATTKVSADILAGRIAKLGEVGDLEYGTESGKTYVRVVPEPATVALLGLGSLLLCAVRKRH